MGVRLHRPAWGHLLHIFWYLFEPDFKHLRHEAFLDNCTADHRTHHSLTSQAWHVDMELSRMPISNEGAARRRGADRAFGKSWVSCSVPYGTRGRHWGECRD